MDLAGAICYPTLRLFAFCIVRARLMVCTTLVDLRLEDVFYALRGVSAEIIFYLGASLALAPDNKIS